MPASVSNLMDRRAFLPLAVLLVSVAVACGYAAATSPAPAGGEIRSILATTVLRVGTQRIAFLLTTDESLIKAPEATVTSVFLGDGGATGQRQRADFHLWPYKVRGAYSTELTFDRPGPWRLDIAVQGPNGSAEAHLALDVAEKVAIPEIGTIPPLSRNRTVHTVDRLQELTSDFTVDPDLY